MSQIPYPDFTSPAFLNAHIHKTLGFYDPIALSSDGGFYGCFLDDGTCFDPHSRQLVAGARYVFNYAAAHCLYGDPKHLDWAKWGLDYLTSVHKQNNGGYAWLIEDSPEAGRRVTDGRVMAYGHAFVLLAAAACLRAGIGGAKDVLRETFDFMERYFWDAEARAYYDERDASLKTLSPYRGQNANMHMCEALLAAGQATGEARYWDRAEILAERFTIDLAAQTGGQIWEHYDEDWRVDMDYNIDKPDDRYKPWGFQPGHQTEWAKLLLILHEERPDPKWIAAAKSLYDKALSSGWDKAHGGIVYGVAPDGRVCVHEKYFWVQAESFAAAWRLYRAAGDERYLSDYNKIWTWCWDHMIDHNYGAWFRVRARDGAPLDNKKSPMGKTDYHTMGACWDVLAAG